MLNRVRRPESLFDSIDLHQGDVRMDTPLLVEVKEANLVVTLIHYSYIAWVSLSNVPFAKFIIFTIHTTLIARTIHAIKLSMSIALRLWWHSASSISIDAIFIVLSALNIIHTSVLLQKMLFDKVYRFPHLQEEVFGHCDHGLHLLAGSPQL